ncbi:hypothetical protein RM780_17475 [Streptomyces sp. DSM 44917]|uniref:Uncharacterized protein n=1 Tax=Streptomyces boetiae TaxID=3075541 RepID=A0ABU2LC23_9ACTN|nr:hypothetical protein [Streptomyces sp. DSM 44917]MDT0308738.1 hypothetical protein [Streptomyces sp. DSM 44917]
MARDVEGEPPPGWDGEELELDALWRHEWLLITRGIGDDALDGLFVTCLPGPDHGRVGRYFNEDAPSFTDWPSMRHLLAGLADALERRLPVAGQVPVVFDGRLLWDEHTELMARPRSPLALARESREPAAPGPEPPPRRVPSLSPDGRYAALDISLLPKAQPPPDQPGLLFVRDVDAVDLLARVGLLRDTLRPRSARQARHAAAAAWAAALPLLRAGRVGRWAFAIDEGGPAQGTRPEVLRRVSAGTLAVSLCRQGTQVRLEVYRDGSPEGEAQEVRSPRTDQHLLADGTLVQRAGGDPSPGATAAYDRLLASLRDRLDLEFHPARHASGELPSGLVLPVLDDIPPWAFRPGVRLSRDPALGGVLRQAAPPELRCALVAQTRRLAAETGLVTFPEIPPALGALGRGEAVPLSDDHPLGLRIRTLHAEARACAEVPGRRPGAPAPLVGREERTAWARRAQAGEALRRALTLDPPAALDTVLSARPSAEWRAELTQDLAAGRAGAAGA